MSSCRSFPAFRQSRAAFNRRQPLDIDARFFFTSARRSALDGSVSNLMSPPKSRYEVKKDGEYTLKRRSLNEGQKGPPDGRLAEQQLKQTKAASFHFRRPITSRYGRGEDQPKPASPDAEPSADQESEQTQATRKMKEHWQIDKAALKQKFGSDGWQPRKKISPDTMEVIRSLHEGDPEKYTTPVLANQFEISPEAIRRILKSKWSATASPEKMEERRTRWARRHDRIWDSKAELGLRPERTSDRKPEDNESQDQIMSYATRPNL